MFVSVASRHGRRSVHPARGSRVLLLGALALGGGAHAADPAPAAPAPSSEAGAAAGSAVEDVAGMIRSMAEALRTLDYEGTFVHLAGGNLTSLSIVHAYAEDGERERLSALDGEAREVFRDRSLVTCIWPDSRSVVVSSSKPRSPLPVIDESLSDNRHYLLSLLDDDRVAGRATRVIEVVPRDELRYGYRFWIDSENAMLLRSMLLDERGHAVEQMMFTQIAYPESIDPARFQIRPEGARASWVDERLATLDAQVLESSAPLPTDADDASVSNGRVRFEGLPDGYRVDASDYRATPAEVPPTSHIVLSDGMASVSVYVEHVEPSGQDHSAAGPARMGAMNAYGLSLEHAFVTAVGEVPARTVHLIARSVRVLP